MNCLPIAERELRVAARRRSTFWLRVAAGLAGVLIGTGAFILSSIEGISGNEVGQVLFYVLVWVLMSAGLASGLFFTSDCLSEEKREGTLGLLFLTELRGYDVVLGKLMATSLRAFYALLAVLPILAITQLLGGISFAQYGKSSLALLNALFLSISAGMFVSTLSRDSQKAMSATLLLLLLFALGGPVADLIISWATKRGFRPVWSVSSPAYALGAAGSWGRAPYWTTLLITQAAGWAMLGLACAVVPRTWQEKQGASHSHTRSWRYNWRYGAPRLRERLRGKWLDLRPVEWLLCRERWQARTLWSLAILILGGFVAVLVANADRENWVVWYYVSGLFTTILYLGTASQACRFLVAARRGGLLELMLVTPLPERAIIRGQWRALLRLFALPVLVLLSVHVSGAVLSQLSIQRIATQVSAATAAAMATNQAVQAANAAQGTNALTAGNSVAPGPGATTNTTSNNMTLTVSVGTSAKVTVNVSGTNAANVPGVFQSPTGLRQAAVLGGAAAIAGLSTAANLAALCWFGMWMALTSRTANQATLKTIVFVQVIPWFVIAFGANALVLGLLLRPYMRSAAQSNMMLMWWPLLTAAISAAITLGKDAGFIAWSRARLYSCVRAQAALGFARPGSPTPAVAQNENRNSPPE